MGASFQTEIVDGNKTPEQLKKFYEKMCGDAESAHGNEYSGDWNMCRGIRIFTEVFPDEKSAEEYLNGKCEKWESALAVRFKASLTSTVKQPTYDGKKINESGMHAFENYDLNGFKLAAVDYMRGEGKIVLADQLTDAQKEKAKRLINAYSAAKRVANDSCAEFHALTGALNDLRKDFKDYNALRMARNKSILSVKAAENAKAALMAYNAERAPKLYEEQTTSDGEKWMIGAVCAS
jgi:hypothetical protein